MAAALHVNEPGFPQQPQMVRNRRLFHREGLIEMTDAESVVSGQQLHDTEADGVGQGGKDLTPGLDVLMIDGLNRQDAAAAGSTFGLGRSNLGTCHGCSVSLPSIVVNIIPLTSVPASSR